MAYFHVISIPLISSGDYPCAHYILGRLSLCSVTHYDIKMDNDVARNTHCLTSMCNDIARDINCDVTMSNLLVLHTGEISLHKR